jgi:hypothetical protein
MNRQKHLRTKQSLAYVASNISAKNLPNWLSCCVAVFAVELSTPANVCRVSHTS